MSAANLELDPADTLRESTLTARLARDCSANQVAAWTLTHHPDLPIAQRWRQLETRYVTLQRAYVGIRSQNGATA